MPPPLRLSHYTRRMGTLSLLSLSKMSCWYLQQWYPHRVWYYCQIFPALDTLPSPYLPDLPYAGDIIKSVQNKSSHALYGVFIRVCITKDIEVYSRKLSRDGKNKELWMWFNKTNNASKGMFFVRRTLAIRWYSEHWTNKLISVLLQIKRIRPISKKYIVIITFSFKTLQKKNFLQNCKAKAKNCKVEY